MIMMINHDDECSSAWNANHGIQTPSESKHSKTITQSNYIEKELENLRSKEWRSNCSFLYSMMNFNRLKQFPSTIQFLSHDFSRVKEDHQRDQRLKIAYPTQLVLYGARDQKEPTKKNRLILAEQFVEFTSKNVPIIKSCHDGQETSIKENSKSFRVEKIKRLCLEEILSIDHSGAINKARVNPLQPNIVSTFSSNSAVFLFDLHHHKKQENQNQVTLILEGHSDQGYGLCWSTFNENLLFTGGNDGLICQWNISRRPDSSDGHIKPTASFKAHNGPVSNVQCSPSVPYLIGSVGEDKILKIWDCRNDFLKGPVLKSQADVFQTTGLSFSPFDESLVVTTGHNAKINLFSLYRINSCMHQLKGHHGPVIDAQWSTSKNHLATSSLDRRILVWDMSKIGKVAQEEEASELIFIHGGHSEQITDFCWNPYVGGMMGSVSACNELQIYKPFVLDCYLKMDNFDAIDLFEALIEGRKYRKGNKSLKSLSSINQSSDSSHVRCSETMRIIKKLANGS